MSIIYKPTTQLCSLAYSYTSPDGSVVDEFGPVPPVSSCLDTTANATSISLRWAFGYMPGTKDSIIGIGFASVVNLN